MNIVPVYRRPDLIGATCVLMGDTWPHYYGPDGIGDANADLVLRNRATGLPYGIIAISDQDDVCATAALQGPSYGSIDGETLWLGGLCVRADLRKRGIATAMVTALQIHARGQGHAYIHATTQSATGMLTRLGWVGLRRFHDNQGEWHVMRHAICST